MCEDTHLHVHKVVMAASSKFFKENLSKASNMRAPVILKLEDFNLKLKKEAVNFIVEFIYNGQVNIPCELLTPVCEAAHALGVQGLTDFLPAPAKAIPPSVQESSTQSEAPTPPTPIPSQPSLPQTSDHSVLQPSACHQLTSSWSDNQFGDFYSENYNPNSRPGNYIQDVSTAHNNFEEGSTIIDLDSNSLDSQPKTRLRIINGSMSSENIHELKAQGHQQQQPMDSNAAFLWMGQGPSGGGPTGFEQQCSNFIDLEPTSWYNHSNYIEEGSSWTTPAVSTSSWAAPLPNPNPAPVVSASTPPAPTLTEPQQSSGPTGQAPDDNPGNSQGKSPPRKDEETKLKPPPPLLAKGGKRPELEVRKDLLPSAGPQVTFATREEIANVFQAEEDKSSPSTTPVSKSESSSAQFKCLDCSMIFASDVQLRSHNRHAHSEQIDNTLLLCPICKTAVLQGLENLKVHLYKSHGIGKVFRCEECNFESSVKSNYMKHLATHSEFEAKKLKICKCGKSFKSKSGLKLHQQTHINKDLHHCSSCTFKTPQRANLIKHLAVKHKKDENGLELKMSKACPLCPFNCMADFQLKNHMLRKHTAKSEMKYKCSQCDYATVESAALKKHVRFKHSNERPFMCNTCGFSTHTHSAMARHKRGHEQTKPYICETCGQAYADRKRLRDHQEVHQNLAKLPFDCDFCGYSTRRKDNLQAHIRRQHPDMNHDSKNYIVIQPNEGLNANSLNESKK